MGAKLTAAAAIVLAALTGTDARAQDLPVVKAAFGPTEGVSRLREGDSTLAPFAYVQFCVQAPGACEAGQGRGEVEWPAVRALVLAVNRQVNRAIRPRNERGDLWRADVSAGDCEDFALTKQRRLIESGLPPAGLRMAVATTAQGEGHAVLVVKTDAGDFVLDNRTDRVLPPDRTDLNWQSIASAEDPLIWRNLF